MKVWGVSEYAIVCLVQVVSLERYNCNLQFKRAPEPEGKAVRFTLTVHRAVHPGGRRGRNGRKIAGACWHCHRDVMQMIFALNPGARIKTRLADYVGKSDFECNFEATGDLFATRGLFPLSHAGACECDNS